MRHILNAPGSFRGPCEDGCEHKSCELEKIAATIPCEVCKEPIGFSNPYQYVDEVPVHVSCLEHPGTSLEDLPDEPPTTSSMS